MQREPLSRVQGVMLTWPRGIFQAGYGQGGSPGRVRSPGNQEGRTHQERGVGIPSLRLDRGTEAPGGVSLEHAVPARVKRMRQILGFSRTGHLRSRDS